MKMQKTVLAACFVLAFSQMGDALKCYQNTNANQTKTLSECPQRITNTTCLAAKGTASITIMSRVETMTIEFFMCTLGIACESFCETQEDEMKKSIPGIKFISCKSYCCNSDKCNEESTNDGYFFVANAKLVGIVMMFICVSFL
ncbi:uncharacterized protein LOC130645166 [Hydractinia symbiolongicarpus]|uniref:uncharacterized protein LOC130645166 n=1 Tax=Hydractinia symbiolongicarpus TaxID=13093 RepID=UPI00254F9A2D|nr:uncharacterized protein LOC130645166 [Hydractinia symbiolongicarpus]